MQAEFITTSLLFQDLTGTMQEDKLVLVLWLYKLFINTLFLADGFLSISLNVLFYVSHFRSYYSLFMSDNKS